MNKICVFTDSAADIPKELAASLDIKILPINIVCGGREIREYEDITPQEYWKLLDSVSETPKTSQVKLMEFYDFFKSAKESGYTQILGILINGAGSGTFSAACTARDMFNNEIGGIEIILLDSMTYSYIYGSVVVEAAKLLRQGENLPEVAEKAKNMLENSVAFAGVYSLRHLRKSGRISGVAAFAGGALGIRPIMRFGAGAADVETKVRGDKNIVTALIECAEKDINAKNKQIEFMNILYADVENSEIERLSDMIKNKFSVDEVKCFPIGPSVTTNIGPNTIALFYRCR